jgi:formylglycine-generating enzyme required for sulfatase activity
MPDFTLPLLEWIDIPAGEVTLEGVTGAFEVQPFKIAKYPVTNAQFEEFKLDAGYKDVRWWEGLAHIVPSARASDWKEPDCPKLEVCWFEAVAFCRWLSDRSGLAVRLPTEWEWQWAAVGTSGWDYPYGDALDAMKCNVKVSGIECTNAVTRYANVTTHFGAVDMAGNVWEWCQNEGLAARNVQDDGSENRALRGGAWNSMAEQAKATFCLHRTPRTRAFNIGFRVVTT